MSCRCCFNHCRSAPVLVQAGVYLRQDLGLQAWEALQALHLIAIDHLQPQCDIRIQTCQLTDGPAGGTLTLEGTYKLNCGSSASPLHCQLYSRARQAQQRIDRTQRRQRTFWPTSRRTMSTWSTAAALGGSISLTPSFTNALRMTNLIKSITKNHSELRKKHFRVYTLLPLAAIKMHGWYMAVPPRANANHAIDAIQLGVLRQQGEGEPLSWHTKPATTPQGTSADGTHG